MKKTTQLNVEKLLVENVLDSIHSALFLLDKDRNVLKYNKAFVDMFKVDFKLSDNKCFNAMSIESEKSGKEHFELHFNAVDNKDLSNNCVLRAAVNKAIEQGTETKNQIVGDEYFINGELKHIYLKFSVKPLNFENNKYILVTIDDISEFETAKFDLLKNNISIKRYNNMYRNELKMAKKVQSSILPKKMFINDKFKINFKYFPLGEIGGDLFDFFKIDNEHIGVLLCDVSGHGVPSALITTMIKALMESSRNLYLEPKNLVKYINNNIIKIFGDRFLTMIYGVLEISTGKFTFVRAGHPKPILLCASAITTVGLNSNIMLGVDEKAKFKEDVLHINKGCKLILYTDGLIDIGRKNSGYEKEIMTLLIDKSELNTEKLLDEIERNVKERLKDEKHQDDICVIMLERFFD